MTNHQGQNWAYIEESIHIFDAAGRDLGKKWEITNTGVGAALSIYPTKFSAKLRQAVNEHDGDDAINVGAANAVLLFLEGVIPLEALKDADESNDSIALEISLDAERLQLVIERSNGI